MVIKMKNVIVIGAGAAGMSAASRAKRLNPSLEVTVLERSNWASFAFCGIPYYVGNIVNGLNDLVFYPPEEFKKRGIDLRFNKEVTEIDANKKVLRFVDIKTGKEEKMSWDKLVIATGARSKAEKFWPEIKKANNVFYIKHLDSAEAIRNYAKTIGEGKKVVLVGSGYVGLELVENLARLGLKVTIIEAMDQILPKAIDRDLAELVEQELKSKNINVIKGAPVESFEINGKKAIKVKTPVGHIEGDMFVIGVGIEPNNELAKMAKLSIGNNGGILVNEKTLTSNEDIYAAGDVTEHKDLITKQFVWRPFAQIANKMGHIAGSNIGGMESIFMGSLGTSALKIFDLIVARTGLSKVEANSMGFDAIEVSLKSGVKAHYIPGGEKRISVKVIADKKTGKLLGAQAIGPSESVFWRINVIASLLTRNSTVWDLFNSDLGYQPTLNPVWDPLIIASRLLMRTLGEKPIG